MLCSSLLGGHTEGCRGAGDVVTARTWSSESPEVVTALGMLSLLWGCTMWMQIVLHGHWDPHPCSSAFPWSSPALCPTAVGSPCGMDVSTRPVPSW